MAHKFNPASKKKLDNDWRREHLPPGETLKKLGLEATDIFADIGCGIGYFTIPAAEMIGRNNAYALDTSPEMLEEVKLRGEEAGLENIRFFLTDEYDLKLADDSVSFALLVNVLHEVDEPRKFLGEICRILKPGGKLAMIDWEKKATEMGPPVDHRIARETVIGMMEDQGCSGLAEMNFTDNFYGLVFENKKTEEQNVIAADKIKIIDNDQFAKHVGLELVKVEVGYAEVKLEIQEKHLNGVGIVQGGALFTLADFAFAAASNAAGKVTVGINANITYSRPAKGKTLLAKATETSASRSLCNYTVDIIDVEYNELVAKFNGTGFIKS
jgi:phenylacetic acid degradation protein PaaD